MFYQTEEYFNKQIQLYGCNFFSCLKISELEAQNLRKRLFRKQDVENLYKFCIANKFMGKDCTVIKPARVIDAGFRYLTSKPLQVYQVGKIEDGKTTYWQWVENSKKYQDYKYKIYRWETFIGGQHFNLYDKKGKKIFDSWQEDVENKLKQELLYYIGDIHGNS